MLIQMKRLKYNCIYRNDHVDLILLIKYKNRNRVSHFRGVPKWTIIWISGRNNNIWMLSESSIRDISTNPVVWERKMITSFKSCQIMLLATGGANIWALKCTCTCRNFYRPESIFFKIFFLRKVHRYVICPNPARWSLEMLQILHLT